MSAFKKGLAVSLAILFILSTLGALLAFNLERTAFDAETYRQAFANQQFYDLLPGIMAKRLAGSVAAESLPPALQGISAAQWEHFIRDLLPPETLQAMGDEALGSLFAYLNGQAETVQVSLAPLKQSMTSDRGVQAVLAAFRAQPDCTLAQLAQMTMGALGNEQIILCNLPEEFYPLITPLVQAQLQAAAAALPDQFTLRGRQPGGFQDSARRRLQTMRLAMRLSPLLPLAFLFALTILVVRSLRDWLMWWGIPMLIAGLLGILTGFAYEPIYTSLFNNRLVPRLPKLFSFEMINALRKFTIELLHKTVEQVLLYALILTAIGLIMIILAAFLRRKPASDRELEVSTIKERS